MADISSGTAQLLRNIVLDGTAEKSGITYRYNAMTGNVEREWRNRRLPPVELKRLGTELSITESLWNGGVCNA